ncbi:E3 SUMO-protein ligase ZBED1-like [Bacillus rossius redtenbacheri]|uniref:E3 SUMO-protein ligase ZBED1-like n=1 Tax=Bacillus rossius redtenbacheri TaxID=93214 RepID=UPI002FDDC530
MAPRNQKTSQIWDYFSEVNNSDGKAKCNFCSKVISYKGGSTFNLTRHVRTIHPTISLSLKRQLPADISRFEEDKPNDPEPSVSSRPAEETSNTQRNTVPSSEAQSVETVLHTGRKSVSTISSYFHKPLSNRKNRDIDNSLTELIVKDYLPYRIVESPAFRKYSQNLNSGYQLPTRKTVSTVLVPQMYEQTKVKVRLALEAADAVTITTDGWTSVKNESYISVTAHYINKDMELHSCLLECFNYDDKHTAVNVAEELRRVTHEWGIDRKVVAVVSDNAANMVAAVNLTGWTHISCFAHNLNLIVQHGLDGTKTKILLTKVKSIVAFFKRSPQACAKLKSMQEQLGEPCLKLKQEVVTRWNSTYDMLQRIVDVKDALASTTAINYPDLPVITNEDVSNIQNVCKLLKVFKDCTEEISSEKQVTASKIILFVKALKTWCARRNSELDENVPAKEIAERLLEGINKRFKAVEENSVFAEATMLDPRFKARGFSDVNSSEKIKQTLISHCVKFGSKSNPTITHEVQNATQYQGSSIWEEFDESVKKLLSNPNRKVAGIVEVDKFLQEPLLPRNGNPLTWWFERREVYPTLFQLAKKRLCVVATSVPCERVFSKAGQIITDRRSRLSGKSVSQILFLNENL